MVRLNRKRWTTTRRYFVDSIRVPKYKNYFEIKQASGCHGRSPDMMRSPKFRLLMHLSILILDLFLSSFSIYFSFLNFIWNVLLCSISIHIIRSLSSTIIDSIVVRCVLFLLLLVLFCFVLFISFRFLKRLLSVCVCDYKFYVMQ